MFRNDSPIRKGTSRPREPSAAHAEPLAPAPLSPQAASPRPTRPPSRHWAAVTPIAPPPFSAGAVLLPSRARAGVRWPRPHPRPPASPAFREPRPLLSVASGSRRSGAALPSVRHPARRGARVTAAALPDPRGPAELPAAVSEPLSLVSPRSPFPRAVAAGAAHAEGGAGRGGPRRRRKLPGRSRVGPRGRGRPGGVQRVPFVLSLRLVAAPVAARAPKTGGGAPKVVGAAGPRERGRRGRAVVAGPCARPDVPRRAAPSVPAALRPARARGVTARRTARFAPPPPCRHRLAFSVARGGEITNWKAIRFESPSGRGVFGEWRCVLPLGTGCEANRFVRKASRRLVPGAVARERRRERPVFLLRAPIAFVGAPIALRVPPWGAVRIGWLSRWVPERSLCCLLGALWTSSQLELRWFSVLLQMFAVDLKAQG